MIANALNRAASAVVAAYFRWLEDVLQQAEGPSASPYVQGVQAMLKGDFRADEAVSLAA